LVFIRVGVEFEVDRCGVGLEDDIAGGFAVDGYVVCCAFQAFAGAVAGADGADFGSVGN